MLPVIFILSLYNTSYDDRYSYLSIFSKITESIEATKELINRTYSMGIIIVFLPLMVLASYLIINFWFTGDFLYFDRIENLQWDPQHRLNALQIDNSISQLLKLAGLLSPLFFISFLLGRRRILVQMVLLLVVVWLMFQKRSNPGEQLFLPTLIIISASAMATLLHLFQTKLSKVLLENKARHVITVVIFLFIITGEYYYFKNTQHTEEVKMMTLINAGTIKNKPAQDMAEFIKNNLNKDDTILSDNNLFYPVMALTRDHVKYLDQFQNSFYSALSKPENFADFTLISNKNILQHQKDEAKVVLEQKSDYFYIVYRNSDYSLYRVKEQMLK